MANIFERQYYFCHAPAKKMMAIMEIDNRKNVSEEEKEKLAQAIGEVMLKNGMIQFYTKRGELSGVCVAIAFAVRPYEEKEETRC